MADRVQFLSFGYQSLHRIFFVSLKLSWKLKILPGLLVSTRPHIISRPHVAPLSLGVIPEASLFFGDDNFTSMNLLSLRVDQVERRSHIYLISR